MIPQEKIIEWARAVDAHRYTNRHFPDQPAFAFDIERLTDFANIVAHHQIGKDARILEAQHVDPAFKNRLAEAIRNQE